MERSSSDIDNFEEAMTTLDNKRNEWNQSLSPLGQFIFSLVNGLRIVYGFPLTLGTKRHASALYALSEVLHVKEQLLSERNQLQAQKRVIQNIENDLRKLLESNTNRIEQWKSEMESHSDDNLKRYYQKVIEYAKASSERIILALGKITVTSIDNEESLVYNGLEQNWGIAFFMQDRNSLLDRLRETRNQRVHLQRVTEQILNNMELIQKPSSTGQIFYDIEAIKDTSSLKTELAK